MSRGPEGPGGGGGNQTDTIGLGSPHCSLSIDHPPPPPTPGSCYACGYTPAVIPYQCRKHILNQRSLVLLCCQQFRFLIKTSTLGLCFQRFPRLLVFHFKPTNIRFMFPAISAITFFFIKTPTFALCLLRATHAAPGERFVRGFRTKRTTITGARLQIPRPRHYSNNLTLPSSASDTLTFPLFK